MNVKEAVRSAVTHVVELFETEKLSNVGLEEVSFDHQEGEWIVTVGFSRPWDYPQNALAALAGQGPQPKRSFKVVRINDLTGEVISIKNRPAD